VRYFSYELNLVFADEKTPRMNLTNHRHLESTREMGRRLADFMYVPLGDQVSGRK
jgi:hypothetical protein